VVYVHHNPAGPKCDVAKTEEVAQGVPGNAGERRRWDLRAPGRKVCYPSNAASAMTRTCYWM